MEAPPLFGDDLKPSAPPDLLSRATDWNHLTRWERAEVGRALRRLGWTYSEIREVIPVAKGTLAGWCSEIRLTEDQIAGIKARRLERVGATRRSREGIPTDSQRKRRFELQLIQREARDFAQRQLDDPAWVAGTCLYWAEGGKSKGSLDIANSDPRLLRLFIAWVRTYHDHEARFVLGLHLHEGNDEPAAQAFWADALALRDPEFHKTFIKPKGTGHRKNHLLHGVCRVRVRRSTDAWIRTMAWIGIVAEEITEGLEYSLANLDVRGR